MEKYTKYKAFISIDNLINQDDLLNSMSILIDSVETHRIESTFNIETKYINSTPFYYAIVSIPKWSESLLIISFPEYNWEEI